MKYVAGRAGGRGDLVALGLTLAFIGGGAITVLGAVTASVSIIRAGFLSLILIAALGSLLFAWATTGWARLRFLALAMALALPFVAVFAPGKGNSSAAYAAATLTGLLATPVIVSWLQGRFRRRWP